MGYLLILLQSVVHNIEGVFVKNYGKKHGSGGMFFNAIISFFSMVYFIISDKDGLNFPPELWIYGLCGALLYATGFYSMYLALQYGSFIMTRLISSFSMLLPLFYGLFFLKEPATVFTYIGVSLIILSLVVRNLGIHDGKGDINNKSFVKWLVCTILTTVSNGFISILSRVQQIRFDDKCSNEFLTICLGGSFLALLTLSIILERDKMGYIVKHGTASGFFAGICNGISNYCTVAIYLFIPMSLAVPLRSGVAFVVSFLFTVFIYRERFTKQQIIGMIMGIAGIIILKI